jgi:sugar fermentation stimulation protein A
VQLPVPLQSATLIRRYKRFLADCDLEDGSRVTAHIADPGRLPGLAVEGARLWLSTTDEPKRKLRHRVELFEAGDSLATDTLVGANTANANRLVAEALASGRLPSLATWRVTAREPRLDPGTRLDFVLADADGRAAFLEVKNITWRRGEVAAFPDAVTARGTKHLATLANLAASGTPAFLLFVCQRSDVAAVTVARDIDPAYAAAFGHAVAAGVRVLACRCEINHCAINITREVPMG